MTKRIEHVHENGVEKKRCGKCEQYHSLDNFPKCNKSWDKLRNTCKSCLREDNVKNKEKRTEYNKRYWVETKESQTQRHKEWVANNKEHIATKNKEYREIHGKEIDKRDWQKRKDDPVYKKKYLEYRKKYDKKKRETDINFKLKTNIGRRIREILKLSNSEKCSSSIKYLGCSLDSFKEHLQSKFTEEMSWDNYGEYWHIDHIIPCKAFDFSDEFEKRACFFFENLQPLEAKENIKKKDHYKKKDKEDYINKVRPILL
jgi:hypothetical protein